MKRSQGTSTVVELSADPLFRVAQIILIIRVLLVVLVFDPLGFDTFAVPKSVAAHLCSALLVALLTWLYLRHGAALVRWSPIHMGVGLVLLSFAVATPFALDLNIALFGAWRRYLGLTQMLDHVVLYVAAATLIRSTADLVRLAVAGGAATVGVVAYAVLQRMGLDPVKFVEEPTVRPISTLGNPDNLGGYLSVAVVTSFAILVVLWSRLAPTARVALAILAAACGGLLLTLGVRNAVLGVAGGLLTTAVIILVSPGRRAARLAAVCGATGAIVAGVAFSGLGARIMPAALATDPAIRERFAIWETTLRLVVARPVLGLGPDNLVAGFPGFRTAEFVSQFGADLTETSTHDWGLYVLPGGGPVALLALAFALAVALSGAVKLTRRSELSALAFVPLAAYLGQGLVDINDLSVDWILWVSLGIIAGATGTAVRIPVRGEGTARPRRLVPVVGIGLVALALIGGLWIEVPRIVASRAMNQSEGLIAIKAGRDAAGEGARAVESDPRRSEYWSSLGTGYAQFSSYAAAQAYTVSSRREPWNPLHWNNLAVTYRAAGNLPGSVAAARRAVHAEPSSSRPHALLADAYLASGNFEAAAAAGRRGLALSPDERSFEPTILAYIKLERWSEAVQLAQDAVARTGSPHFRLRLAQAFTGAGQIAQAKEQLGLVLAVSPGDSEALDLRSFLDGK